MNEIIAKIIFFFGVRPKASTGIDGETTYGYGKLDNNGYWQYMLWDYNGKKGYQ